MIPAILTLGDANFSVSLSAVEVGSVAAIASAFAAIMSFITACAAVSIQRRNLRESQRPELVLVGWERCPTVYGNGGSPVDTLHCVSIRNVGKGPALYISATYQIKTAPPRSDPAETWRSTIDYIQILAAGDSHKNGSGEILLRWRETDTIHSVKAITIELRHFDSQGSFYLTSHLIYASKGTLISGGGEIAQNTILARRWTTVKGPRRFRIEGWIHRYRPRVMKRIEEVKRRLSTKRKTPR